MAAKRPIERLVATEQLRLHLPAFKFAAITLVGCGGTGSHIASGLLSVAQALAERQVHVEILFRDPDVVEPKNVGRQLFSTRDVGRPKAQVLAERMNGAYGSRVGYVLQPYAGGALGHPDADLNLVIGAVDNAAARAAMLAAVKAAGRGLWWLDAGNENHTGQVALGNVVDGAAMAGAVGLGLVDRLPAPSLVYPDLAVVPNLTKLKRGTKSKATSCAELAATGEQGLMVNRMAAAWALAMLHDFLLGELAYFALAFNLQPAGARPYVIDTPTLSEVTGLSAAALQIQGKGEQ